MVTQLKHRPEALFLDAGDTIIFLDPDAVAEALADEGERVAPEAIARALHPAKRHYQARLATGHSHEDGWSVLVSELLTRSGLAPARAQELLPALRRVHDDFYFWRAVPPELPAALERALAGGIRLAIISNSEGRLESVLQRVGVREHFERVVDSHLVGMQKPDPAIFRHALELLGVAAERSVYAGDIPEVDVLGSRAVGMHGALIDAFGDYEGRQDLARFPSTAALIDALLALPVR
jgi:putative hydrolase of the HAD superfamily